MAVQAPWRLLLEQGEVAASPAVTTGTEALSRRMEGAGDPSLPPGDMEMDLGSCGLAALPGVLGRVVLAQGRQGKCVP